MYTPEAEEDLFKIRNIIEERWDNPQLARKVLQNITQSIRKLEIFPYMGIELRRYLDIQTEYRSLFCGQNYVFCRIENEMVRIIRILNEREDFMRILFGVEEAGEDGGEE